MASREIRILSFRNYCTSGITVVFAALFTFSQSILTGTSWSQNLVTVQIEYYVTGIYGDQYTSLFYEALSWLISQQTKKLDKGAFIVQPTNSVGTSDEEDCSPPSFNILPEKSQQITIEFNNRKFHVEFNMPEGEKTNTSENNNNSSNGTKQMPSIYLSTTKDFKTNVDSISEFLNEVTRTYLETQKKQKTRSRYERNDGYWYKIQSLSSNRGLDSVALDEPQEKLLEKEINTFINDKEFYQRIGMPYKRGILLYGKPGTGKTSLINAITSHLSRDLYYLNLKNITDDNELSAAFSSIPANQILILEDVDTQSKVLHKRKGSSSDFNYNNSSENKVAGPSNKGGSESFSKFSLSTFLSCCDGHILAEGIIIIMTTNHIELLDPGRFDLHLDLGYATHYQIAKMYNSVIEDPKAQFPSEIMSKIPEHLLPPCEIMMTMVLYRNEKQIIPQKILELVKKYEHMSPEEIAKKMEEEALRIKDVPEIISSVNEKETDKIESILNSNSFSDVKIEENDSKNVNNKINDDDTGSNTDVDPI
ncbi:7293_t:CDS:2 [Diversispora eburnea]|uniref:7293_t:CDS:1 n=1 Tax=Diversispora eburnea TaxID=1213867 RepID=A0A9N9EY60_9GLOM|nr:7293_t:CDS:2 [Diversispora eburnea]